MSFGGGSSGEIKYVISVDDSQAVGQLQSFSQQIQGVSPALDNVAKSTNDVDTAQKNTQSSSQSFGSSMASVGTSIAFAASSVISLITQYQSLKKAENTLERAQNISKGQVITLTDLRNKYNKAVEKYGKGSKEAEQALKKLHLAEDKHQTQLEKIDLMQESLSQRMWSFAVSVVPTSIGVISGLAQTMQILGQGRGGAGGIKGVIGMLTKFGGPLLIVGGIALAIKTNFLGFRDALDAVGNAIGDAVPQLRPFLDAIRNIGIVLGLVPGDAKKAQAELKTFAGGIIAWGKEVISTFQNIFDALSKGDVVAAIDIVKDSIKKGFKSIGIDIQKEWDKFNKDPLKYIADVIMAIGNTIWTEKVIGGFSLEQWFIGLPKAFQLLVDREGAIPAIIDILTNIGDMILPPDSEMKLKFDSWMAAVKAKFIGFSKDPTGGSVGIFQGMWDNLINGPKGLRDLGAGGGKDELGTQVNDWLANNIGKPIVEGWNALVASTQQFIKDHPVIGKTITIIEKTIFTPGRLKQLFDTYIVAPIADTWFNVVIPGIQKFITTNPIIAKLAAGDILGAATLAANEVGSWLGEHIGKPIGEGWGNLYNTVSKFVSTNPIIAKLKAGDILGAATLAVGEINTWLGAHVGKPIGEGWGNLYNSVQKFIATSPIIAKLKAGDILGAAVLAASELKNWFAQHVGGPIGIAWVKLQTDVTKFFTDNPVVNAVKGFINYIFAAGSSLQQSDVAKWFKTNIQDPVTKAWTAAVAAIQKWIQDNPILGPAFNALSEAGKLFDKFLKDRGIVVNQAFGVPTGDLQFQGDVQFDPKTGKPITGRKSGPSNGGGSGPVYDPRKFNQLNVAQITPGSNQTPQFDVMAKQIVQITKDLNVFAKVIVQVTKDISVYAKAIVTTITDHNTFAKTIVVIIKDINTYAKTLVTLSKDISVYAKAVVTTIKDHNTFAKTIVQIIKDNNTYAKTIVQLTKNISAYAKAVVTTIKDHNTLAKTIVTVTKDNNTLAKTIVQVGKDFKSAASSATGFAKALNGVASAAKSAASAIKSIPKPPSGVSLASGGLVSFAEGGMLSAAGGLMTTSGPRILVGDNPGGNETIAAIPRNNPNPMLDLIDRSFGRNRGGGSIVNQTVNLHISGNDIVNERTLTKRIKITVGENRDKFGG